MTGLEKRINKVETKVRHGDSNLSLLSDTELTQRVDGFLAQMGTTHETVIAEFGSLKIFAAVLRGRGDQHGTS